MIRSEVDEGVRVLTLDRPDALNAFNADQFELLAELLVEGSHDAQTRVVVLTGNGRAFSSGADLSGSSGSRAEYKYGLEGCINVIIDFPKPFIVAANGLGVGIGATILGLADESFMAASSRMRCPFSALGLTGEACSTYNFPRLMGPQAAAQFLLGAEWWTSAQCKAAGLVLDVFPDDSFMTEVMSHAKALAKWPVTSLIETKALLIGPHRDALKKANRDENAALKRLSGAPANLEAIRAFREKREPDFSSIES